MKIGNNIHSENKKKVYRKPLMDVVAMDRDMRLIMMTPDGHPGGKEGPAPSFQENNTSPNKPTYKEQSQPSNNPFGGGTPDYER